MLVEGGAFRKPHPGSGQKKEPHTDNTVHTDFYEILLEFNSFPILLQYSHQFLIWIDLYVGKNMTLDINLTKHEDYLEIKVTGSYDLNDASDKFSHVLDACKFNSIYKVLLDNREITGRRDGVDKIVYVMNIYDYYQEYLRSNEHELQIAFVSPIESRSDYEPGEKLSDRIELPFKRFDSIDKALEWLNVKQI